MFEPGLALHARHARINLCTAEASSATSYWIRKAWA